MKLSLLNKILIFPALIIPFLKTYCYFILFSEHLAGKIIYGVAVIYLIGLPFYWLLSNKNKISIFFRRKGYVLSLIMGLISGIIFGGLILFLFFQNPELIEENRDNILLKVEQFNLRKYYLLFTLFLILFNSLVEEWYWRCFTYTGLRQFYRKLPSLLASSLAFSAHHFIILAVYFPPVVCLIGGLAVGLAGLTWCYILEKTGNIVGSAVSHMLADIAIMICGYLIIFKTF